jgi:hypothetical protein
MPFASQWAAVDGAAGRRSVMVDTICFGRRTLFRTRQGSRGRHLSWWKRWLRLTLLGALLSGCSGWMGPPAEIQYDSQATQQLMHQLLAANAGLEAIKGLGRVTVTTNGSAHTYERAVWVGAAPGRLRFVFQAPTGMPVFTMSCDAEWVTALNYGDGRYYRHQIGDNSLSRFLPVSIKCADLYALLVDRPPKVVYDTVRLDTAPQSTTDDSLVLLLQRRFRGTVGRIRVDRNTGELQSVELLDIHGNRLYEARLQAIQTIDGYRLPTRITLNGPDGSLVLDIRRCWPEASVTEDLFRIAPPQTE